MLRRSHFLKPRIPRISALSNPSLSSDPPAKVENIPDQNFGTIENHLHLEKIILAMQRHGHTIADTNPLERQPRTRDWQIAALKSILGPHVPIPEQEDDVYRLPSFVYFGSDWKNPTMSLGDIYDQLFKSYAGPLGVEYMHIKNEYERLWIREKFEKTVSIYEDVLSHHRKMTLKKLLESRVFEQFVEKMYPNEATSSMEGCDVLIPALKILVNIGMERGAKKFSIGMPSRGRLNLLANFLNKDLKKLLSLLRSLGFSGKYSGDVKYHLGSKVRQEGPRGTSCEISLSYNPSHKEMSNTIVAGKAAADQRILFGNDNAKVWPILIHGDNAIQGHGILYEYFNLCNMKQYKSSGTIHFIINNQLGSESSDRVIALTSKCSDIAKMIGAPIIHVNADEIDHVLYATILAARYKSTFHNDIVIDLIGYKRSRANQPSMAFHSEMISSHPPVCDIYKNLLLKEELTTGSVIDEYAVEYKSLLEKKYEESLKETVIQPPEWQDEETDPAIPSSNLIDESMFDKFAIKQIAHEFTSPPPEIVVHDKLLQVLHEKKIILEEGYLDFSLAESLAITSLLKKYLHVRFSGLDVQRGAFYQRDHIIQDQRTTSDGNRAINVLSKEWHGDEKLEEYLIFNTPMSPSCTLGFELGYSTCKKDVCVIWEAQFGDLSNTAQVIIDQFVVSMEEKWGKSSGIIILLPHGLEGEGPDKSSARPERFLQMVYDDYEQILDDEEAEDILGIVMVNVSTSANYYHAIRKQYQVNVRRPLVVLTPKSHLKNSAAMSKFEEFYSDKSFKPYIPDPHFTSASEKSKVRKVLLCTGKIYYALIEERKKKGLDNEIAIGRVEQIHPLPKKSIQSDLESLPSLAQVFWVQEEHRNQGFWTFMKPRLDYILGPSNKVVGYIGRKPHSSGAQIFKGVFRQEERDILDEAFKYQ